MKNNLIIFSIGFVCIFIVYALVFGLLFADYFQSMIVKYPSVFRSVPLIPVIAVAHAIQTVLFIYLFKRMKVETIQEGMISGVILFVLIEAVFIVFIFANISFIPFNYVLIDILLSAIPGAIGGGVLGFAIGKFKD